MLEITTNHYYILGLLLAKGKIRTHSKTDKLDIILEIRFNKPSDKSLRSDNKHNDLNFDNDEKSMYDYILPDIIKLWNIMKESFPQSEVILEYIPEPENNEDFSKKVVRWIIKDINKESKFIEYFWGNKKLNKPSDIDSLPNKIKDLMDKSMEKRLEEQEISFIKYFMLGISDSAAIIPGPESAAFGAGGTQRIQIEVDQPRWKLNIAMLVFLQEVLKIPVLNINWPHPTIKSRNNPRISLKHNHQFRAHLWSYKNLGFMLSIKKRAFDSIIEKMSSKSNNDCKFYPKNRKKNKFIIKEEYIKKYPNVTGLTTTPFRCSDHSEDSELLPPEVRGKHYAEWRDINFDLGDPYLKEYPSNESK